MILERIMTPRGVIANISMFLRSTGPYIAGGLTVAEGLFVLINRIIDNAAPKDVVYGSLDMGTYTATGFILGGLALILSVRTGKAKSILVRICASLIMLGGLIFLIQNSLSSYAGFNEFLNGIHTGVSHTPWMQTSTALIFLMVGISLSLLSSQNFRTTLPLEFLLVFSFTASIVGLVGGITGLDELATPAAYTKMGFFTAITFIILCGGLILTAYGRQQTPIAIEQKLFDGLTAATVAIISISLLSVSGIRSLLQASDWVEHSRNVSHRLYAVGARTVDVETGARGYLLSGDEQYYEPTMKAREILPALVHEIGILTRDNPRQQESVELLEQLTKNRLAFADHLRQTFEQGGREATDVLFKAGMEKMLTDSIKVLIGKMLEEENRLLSERKENEARQASLTQFVIYISLAGQVLLLSFVFAVAKRDVTGRRKAEELLQQKTAELDGYFKHALDLLCIADMDGYFRRLNKSWESTLGYSLHDLEGKRFLDFVHPEDVNATLAVMSDLGEGKLILNFTNRYRHNNGSYRWIEWRSFPSGNLIYATARDITERKCAEEALQASKTQLEAANKELESFSYSVSHDLRAPLRGIDGFSKALLKDYGEILDDQGKDFLRRVSGATHRMAALIDDLLKLSRITRTEMHREKVNLSRLVAKAAEELQQTQPSRSVEFIIADKVNGIGDPHLLRVCIENLLGNAWKYTGKVPDAKIEFGVKYDGEDTVHFVRDNGAGFDMAYVDKLFGAFQRLHSTAEFEGTGIGLATVQRIIHRHGGRVWAEAEVNKGATFYFTLAS